LKAKVDVPAEVSSQIEAVNEGNHESSASVRLLSLINQYEKKIALKRIRKKQKSSVKKVKKL
jgi:transcription termination factor Rho